MAHPTSRTEIADAVERVFDGPTRHRDDLILAAKNTGARERVIDTLTSLPDDGYESLSQLWQHLPDVQIEP